MKLKRQRYSSFIGGDFIEHNNEKVRNDICPADGSVLAELCYAGNETLDDAVNIAQNAFKDWGKTKRTYRSKILNEMADVMENNLDYLAFVEAKDVGKPITEARMQMELCVAEYRYFASTIVSQDEAMIVHDNGSISAILREPLGVVGLILPWNAPAMLLSWKAAPALAAGNCVIVKPASAAPLIILELARLWADVIPAGVFNVLLASGAETGEAMLNHGGINKFSFTGSTSVGTHVGEVAGRNIVPCTLELGGKSANIVFEDAQLDRALQYTMLGILSTQGEICVGGSRLLLQKSIYDAFIERLKEKFESLTVGDPTDPENKLGPLIDEGQLKKVLEYVEIGKNEGARLVCGGNRIISKGRDKGFYVEPTIFADVNNSMRIAQEEIFGPVLSVIPFEDEEDAIRIANDSKYGLGAGVWTKDLSRAIRVGRAIEAGTVWVNDYLTSTPGNPFGGYKNSGIGREIHKMALDNYTNIKNLCLCPDEAVPELF